MGGAEAVMKVALVREEVDLAGMAVGVGLRMGMLVAMLVGMSMGMAVIVRVFAIMTFDSGFAFAATADSTHSQTPEFTRPTNP
jgi:hypothetical protein